MAKFLVNEQEVAALKKLLESHKLEGLQNQSKPFRYGNFPLRFKLLEAMGATTANKANAAIFFFGDSTGDKIDTDLVVDDSSSFPSASSGDRGFCFASSEYNVAYIYNQSAASTATEYMASVNGAIETTDATVDVDGIQGMNGASTQTAITVQNKFSWAMNDNANIHFKYNQHSSAYEAIQVDCT